MATLPHDITDLYLAPVVLAVDGRLEELGQLDLDKLRNRVALIAGGVDQTREMRERGLLRTVSQALELHSWRLSWDPRGLRLQHDAHDLTLGVPPVFAEYLAG